MDISQADQQALRDGVVEITLSGETLRLVACEDAADRIERQFGGLRPALPRLDNHNRRDFAAIIAAGAGLTGKRAEALPSRIFRNGTLPLVAPLSKFLVMLMNGGRLGDVDESDAETDGPSAAADGEGAAGNA